MDADGIGGIELPDREHGKAGSLTRFASGFPERFGSVLSGARGALDGIGAAGANGKGGEALLDAESLRCYHEIYRLRIELELETAAILWRAAEVSWALVDTIEAVNRTLGGDGAAVEADAAAGRRALLIPPPSPLDRDEPEPPGAPAALPAGVDAPRAHRLWSDALAERRAAHPRRRGLFRRGRAKTT
jgi:hypothetical protein